VARNRKRAKERRARRPEVAVRPRLSPANGEAAPNPIEHAAPDVELADAQLALGRRELTDDYDPDTEAELEEKLLEEELEDQRQQRLEETVPAVAPHRAGLGTRLVGFLQGSWRELQRVQWPDRRQVVQATGVVIGFVIVAGVFLGVADLVSQKLMNFILK
jgi:preprotein translocase SecE subunit